MARILIGNIKGPKGDTGPQGAQGPTGPQGPKGDTGPMPTLINNAVTTSAGVGALDAAMGKTLGDQIDVLNNNWEQTATKDDLTALKLISPIQGLGVVNNDWVVTGGVCRYRVVNGIAFIRFDMEVKEITADNTLLVSGLPQPSFNAIYQCTQWRVPSVGVPLEIIGDGSLVAYPCSGTYIAGTMVYPVL